MLVLTRKIGERIVIANSIIVTVLDASKNKVRIGITAPDDVSILREELAFSTSACQEARQEAEPEPTLTVREGYWAEASEVFLG